MSNLADPLELSARLWPSMRLYRQQREIVRSVWDNDETYVYAGNMLGKDFVAGRIVVLFFLTRSPCRIVTTSTKDAHLAVLWGEIHQAIRDSVIPLNSASGNGGTLIINQRELRKIVDGQECPISYVRGMVANESTMQSFQGHHVANYGDGIPRTLMVGDEASSLRNEIRRMTISWANRRFWFGNTWPCENFYRHALEGTPGTKDKGGDIPRPNGLGGFYRWCTRVTAEDSPNVIRARMYLGHGLQPPSGVIIPGVKSWEEYQANRLLWDELQQQVSLDARFPRDSRVKMFPEEWLDLAEERARKGGYGSIAESVGVDSAQGGDNTAYAVAHRRALLELVGIKTSDTTKVLDVLLSTMLDGRTPGILRRYPTVKPEKVYFDQGGGGKEHVDRARSWGYEFRLVYFGASATPEPEPGVVTLDERIQRTEQRTAYKNKRAELYCLLRHYLNPAEGHDFAIPAEILNRPRSDGGPSLREQMQAVPLEYNEEGQIYVRPKSKRDKNDTRETLTDMIGCSPDELDATALAVYGLEAEERWATVGVGY